MDIKEKISGLAADITISTQGDWIAEIPVESFRMVPNASAMIPRNRWITCATS